MTQSLLQQACTLLGEDWQARSVQAEVLTPDGSLRRFCRLCHPHGEQLIAIAPPVDDESALREAVAGWKIGNHLYAKGVPVPRLHAFDRKSGLLICEDLGNTRLHDLLIASQVSLSQIQALYEQVVTQLALMQVRGRDTFDTAWCWDTPRYDQQLMLERESGYFLQALCLDMLGISVNKAALQHEFTALAQKAARADAGFFLHRDFQSRNIMVADGRVCFIDYQAARLGPLGYDLASLLIDPYAGLPADIQEGLLECYLDALTAMVSYDRDQFTNEYKLLAVQRNLQILGAFAFLSEQRGKLFFKGYIRPALQTLTHTLSSMGKSRFPFLAELVEQCLTDL